MAKEKSARQIFLAGIVEENPILVLMIGRCPLLAVSSNANDALGMGVAASFARGRRRWTAKQSPRDPEPIGTTPVECGKIHLFPGFPPC